MIRILDLFSGTQSQKKASTLAFEIDYWDFINGVWRGMKEVSTYANRSSVPPKLIQEIFSQIMEVAYV